MAIFLLETLQSVEGELESLSFPPLFKVLFTLLNRNEGKGRSIGSQRWYLRRRGEKATCSPSIREKSTHYLLMADIKEAPRGRGCVSHTEEGRERERG